MRRMDREMARAFALEVLDKCEWAMLATVGISGAPYCVPVTIVREGEYIYFHGALGGEKAENLRARRVVCLTAVGDTHIVEEQFTTEYESTVVRGTAEELTDPEEKTRILRLLCQRHTPRGMFRFDQVVAGSLARTGIWGIRMEEVTAKRNKHSKEGQELKYGATEG